MNTMLLFDDDVYSLEALAIRLGVALRNWNILTTHDSRKGLEILDSKPVHCIITDVEGAKRDGLGIIMRRNECYPNVPLYAIIDRNRPDLASTLRALYVSECIEKPFDFEAVTNKILIDLKMRWWNAACLYDARREMSLK